MKAAIAKIKDGRHLTADETAQIFGVLMDGQAEPALVAALLTAMAMNGVDSAELCGAATAMRARAIRIPAKPEAVDIVGTGGDGLGTFNCSTTAAIVAAGAGATVAKHGNRSATSSSGAADCLAALGYNLDRAPEAVSRDINEGGIGFLFANRCHPAMRNFAPVRSLLPFRTIFNLLGPIVNPAGVAQAALGVYDPSIVPLYVDAVRRLGFRHALVFCGEIRNRDGRLHHLDEISAGGTTLVVEIDADGTARESVFDAKRVLGADFTANDIAGGSAEANAALLRAVVGGVEKGAYRIAACLNAAAALQAAGLVGSLEEGLVKAAEAIDSGRAASKLERLIKGAS